MYTTTIKENTNKEIKGNSDSILLYKVPKELREAGSVFKNLVSATDKLSLDTTFLTDNLNEVARNKGAIYGDMTSLEKLLTRLENETKVLNLAFENDLVNLKETLNNVFKEKGYMLKTIVIDGFTDSLTVKHIERIHNLNSSMNGVNYHLVWVMYVDDVHFFENEFTNLFTQQVTFERQIS